MVTASYEDSLCVTQTESLTKGWVIVMLEGDRRLVRGSMFDSVTDKVCGIVKVEGDRRLVPVYEGY